MSKFEQALKVDPTPLLKKKGKEGKVQVEYLPWASSWSEFKKVYPNGNFNFIHNQFGGYVHEERIHEVGSDVDTKVIGYFVRIVVTDGEETPTTHEIMLPIMDFKNKANMNFTIMEVNKALFRALTKCVSLFGPGLTTYAGEEHYQYEIGAELDELKEKTLSLAKEISEFGQTQRNKAIEIIGYKGHAKQIKTTEEAIDKIEELELFLAEEKAKADKKKTTTKNTKKTEEK